MAVSTIQITLRLTHGKAIYCYCEHIAFPHGFPCFPADMIMTSRKHLLLSITRTGGSTPVIPVTSHRSIQKVDVWHRSNSGADPCLFKPPLLRQHLEGIMPRIDFLKTPLGQVDLGRGGTQLNSVLATSRHTQ